MNFWKESTNLFRELLEKLTFSAVIQTNTFPPSSKYFLTSIKRNPSLHFTPFCLKDLFSVDQSPDSALHKIRGKAPICSNRSTRQTRIHDILSLSTHHKILHHLPCQAGWCHSAWADSWGTQAFRIMWDIFPSLTMPVRVKRNQVKTELCYTRFTKSQWQQYLALILPMKPEARRRKIIHDGQRLGEFWKLPSSLLFE